MPNASDSCHRPRVSGRLSTSLLLPIVMVASLVATSACNLPGDRADNATAIGSQAPTGIPRDVLSDATILTAEGGTLTIPVPAGLAVQSAQKVTGGWLLGIDTADEVRDGAAGPMPWSARQLSFWGGTGALVPIALDVPGRDRGMLAAPPRISPDGSAAVLVFESKSRGPDGKRDLAVLTGPRWEEVANRQAPAGSWAVWLGGSQLMVRRSGSAAPDADVARWDFRRDTWRAVPSDTMTLDGTASGPTLRITLGAQPCLGIGSADHRPHPGRRCAEAWSTASTT